MARVFGVKSQGNWFYSLWKFSRPHTIIGTTLSVVGLYLVAVGITNSSFSVITPLGAWVSCICGNIYIVGLNQLEDVAIDKINKPHLPLAAGEFSQRTAQVIVGICAFLAASVAFFQGPYLFWMVVISLAIGTAYSLPPIRLKRYPFWAALCIFSVRGAIVNLGLYLHYSWVLQNNSSIPAAVWALTLFVLVFTFAIAIFKDIPDMEGDLQYNITTFTIQLGKEAVFKLARWVITVCYVAMILAGLFRLANVNAILLVISHIILLVWMWRRSKRVDLQDKTSIASFYQFIWKLFFIEYLIFPISTLL
ncbi:homogentisate phytyltransferase [Dulcicalothrix desertica PCC 7102]|uniref:Homogentisate phytyltransferase n=1 Tax=Dulcicalothrix desertica PCC 7102 TaxID=232991 RepID=A0A433VBU9_9CYAN|nr:homogentisate phytyltransferase [Dulcicalothrix desertica]RUT03548.1 homogentisate phytyltransferase [Dulcicalothrix desertica PCC 7102]TWH50530.1 homogentisate phytyltransferase/homogentisate geranylgeranyltransferase [Dulcicalothrix desertica PCC 7102]